MIPIKLNGKIIDGKFVYGRRNKYGNYRIFAYGRSWGSKLELATYELLLNLQSRGKIKNIRCQRHVRFTCETYGPVHCIPDFELIMADDSLRYCESKGFKDRRWVRIRNAWLEAGPAEMDVFEGSWQKPWKSETLIPALLKKDE